MLQWAMENIPTAAIPKPSFILATPMQEPLVHFLKYFTGKKSGVNLFIMGGSGPGVMTVASQVFTMTIVTMTDHCGGDDVIIINN